MSKRKVEGRYPIPRKLYKALKSYDHGDMEEYLYGVYMDGYEKGQASM